MQQRQRVRQNTAVKEEAKVDLFIRDPLEELLATNAANEQEAVVVDQRTEAERLMDDTLDRGKNALMTAVQTKEMAAATLQELDKQGEQIINAQRNVDTILHDAELAKRSTNSISSSFWTFVQKFTSPPPRQDHVNIDIRQKSAVRQQEVDAARVRSTSSTAVIIEATANSTFQEKMRASDAQLDQLSNQLDDIHGMALDMNVTLDEQNKRLDVLNETTGHANAKLDDLNRRTGKLLGKR